MKGGFLNGGNKSTKPKQTTTAQQNKSKVEDLTHLKAKSKDENLKIPEVQNAISSMPKQEDWLNEDFLKKMTANPKLL